ncbi:MAG: hypothetical protein LBQ30_04670 [Treponema sp.]|nr:hypothetical protein [Treponema sp.]
MRKVKVNGIAGGVGFMLSLLIGLISGGGFLIVLIRALGFGVGFLVLTEIFQRLISTFLPELLNPDAPESTVRRDAPGSRVDISVEDTEHEKSTDWFDKVTQGNDASPTSNAELDQDHGKDYTQEERTEAVPGAPFGFVPSAPVPADSLFAAAAQRVDPFLATADQDGAEASKKAQNPGKELITGKNLDPRKMASAIQTILKQA